MIESAISIGAVSLTILGQIQEVTPGSIYEIVMTYGGMGLAVYLVLHYTHFTIPSMNKTYKEERQQILAAHDKAAEQMRKDFKEELTVQRSDFKQEIAEQRSNFILAIKEVTKCNFSEHK